MLSENQKRKANLSILQRLRQQGLPKREEQVDSMFDSIGGDLAMAGDEPEYEMESPSKQEGERAKAKDKEKEKRGGPNLNPAGVEAMKSAFRKQR